MPSPPFWSAAATLTPMLALALQGCTTRMTAPAQPPSHQELHDTLNRVEDGPFRFWSHNLGVYAFSTWGCRVTYGPRVVWNDPSDHWNAPFDERPPGMRERMRGSQGPFKNTEGAMTIEWLDAGRTPRRTVVDVPALLAHGVIPHSVKGEDILPSVTIHPPDLIVEVDDRTVRLYLQSEIPLRSRAPRNPALNDVKVEQFLIYEDLDAGNER